MTLVVDIFRKLLPAKAKTSPSGWTSFNAPCCHHRGHKRDTRKRGGVRFDHGIIYNCFNCKYSTSWQPGRTLTEKFKSLCRWMGANDDDIKDMVFEALKTEAPEYIAEPIAPSIVFEDKKLPDGALPLKEWANNLDETIEEEFVQVLQYLIGRGFNDPLAHDFYWTPLEGFGNRVIVPFRYQHRVTGYTARKVTDGRPKYISEQHPHFVFNIDTQSEDQKYIFVTEGPFDAINISGVALLTNEIADQQARIINTLGCEVIVIPDQDKAGLNLFNRAAELDWSVASPNWDDDVKDVADAVQRYGKLFVVVDAIKTAQKGTIKINMAKKALEHKLERIKHNELNN